MKLLYKLISGYLILVVLALIANYVSVRSYQNIENTYNQISTRALPHIRALEEVKVATLHIVASTSEYGLLVSERNSAPRQEQPQQQPTAEPEEGSGPDRTNLNDKMEEDEEELIQAGKTAFSDSLSRYEVLIIRGTQTDLEAQLANKIRRASQSLLGGSTKLTSLKKNSVTGHEVTQAKEEFEESERLTLSAINTALEHEYSALNIAETKIRAVISSATWATTLIGLTAVFLALLVGYLVARSVSRRIGKLKDATQKISAGNLDEHIAITATDEIGDLARAFNLMTVALKQTQYEVCSAKNFTDNIIESMTDLLVVADAAAVVQRVNTATFTILGFPNEEVVGHPLSDICADHNFLSTWEGEQLTAPTATFNFEKICATKDGRQIPMSISVAALRDFAGQPQGLVCVGRDITESKRAAEKIQASLVEKEVLLKEVHHRVKNNLQIISSLLNMQSKRITDEKSRAIFLDSQNRVKTMALIHESLYQSADLAQIDFDEYLRKLASHILRSYNLATERVRLTFSSSHLQMSVDAAVPCGLIINELISNSLKYAFPANRNGVISIALQRISHNYVLRNG